MICLAAKLMQDKRLNNPTIILLNDRKDLDGQLFNSFCLAKDLLIDSPKKAKSREDLRKKLKDLPSGGIIFSTIQKFSLNKDEDRFPKLSDRDNIIVICDEAHRTQYGFKAKVNPKTGAYQYGHAKNVRDALPNATFVAFTGTPISFSDRNTRSIFGQYNSIYDLDQAVTDGATVPIYYDARQAKLEIKKEYLPKIDDSVEAIFEDEDDINIESKVKAQWSDLESLVGTKPRLQQIAKDFIDHYEKRSLTQPGKAMIVCMSREICVHLYDEIIAIRPQWHDPDIDKGEIKVVMHASASDKLFMQDHHTSQTQREALEKRFKDPDDSLKIVLVRNMWLTGFDAPCLATMYIDKPMKGANLAQAISRVNRVFKDKPGGLVVDYIGITPQLRDAIAEYSSSNTRPNIDIDVALQLFLEKMQDAKEMLHPIDWSEFKEPTKALDLLSICSNHILGLQDGKKDFADVVLAIDKSFAICSTHEIAVSLNEEVAFLGAIRSIVMKGELPVPKSKKDKKYNLQQLLSNVLVGTKVTDVFELTGLKKPDISILSEGFLAELQNIPQKNLAADMLQRLLRDQISSRFKSNIVKKKVFSELLQKSLNRYANRTIETAQVIEELIEIAKKFKEESIKLDNLGLNPDEIAFYDALANNKSAQELMGDKVLARMAREIAVKLRESLTIDWQYKDDVQAKLRIMIRSLLVRYKYPPDQEENAIELVLAQAEALSEEIS